MNFKIRKSKNAPKLKGLLDVKKLGKAVAIIFVHGLQGDPYTTWTKKGCRSLPHLFMDDKAYKNFDIFTFGYNTGFVFNRDNFKEVSDLLYTEIDVRLKDYNSIFFITHSMGGIIVQSMLEEQVERRNKKFIKRVYGIVYLAVPFLGSPVATTASIPYIFLPPFIGEQVVSLQVRSLKVFSKELTEVSKKWVRYRNDDLSHVEELNIYGQSDMVVPVPSANAHYIKNSFAVDEGHISICKMDKDSTAYIKISNFLGEKGQIINICSMDDSEREMKKYLQWLKLRTEKFIVPGINVPLSIEHAWASLYVIEESDSVAKKSLEEEIAKYHEWERLSHHHRKKSAQEITELGRRVVLIGGPGSGKSTLAKRAAYRMVSKGEKVIYVRLPFVAKEMNQGKSFEDALWSVALDGYSGNKEILKSEIMHPSILIADGLDECEPSRRRISQSLYDWCIGRQDTRVIVTTRPVGYEAALFSAFNHVEILPLNEDEIESYSLKLLEILKDDEKLVAENYDSFKQQLKNNKMANVAARSPLLLNFLIQLLVSGKSFGKYRSELYRKILEEWMAQSDRVNEIDFNSQIALRTIELIGWIIQSAVDGKGGRSEQEIIQLLSSNIKDEYGAMPLQSRKMATEYLQFWVNVGVIEKLSIGYENGYTFIHFTLGEYAAGKFIYSLPEDKQKEVLLEKMHAPIWRETLLLAGGIGCARLFVETIMENMNEEQDLYNDLAFAVSILSEIDSISDLKKTISEKTIDTISSPIPMLCFEAGEALEGIAQQEPDWIFNLVQPLLQHTQDWTKLVAYKLTFMTSAFTIDTATLLTLLNLQVDKSINFHELHSHFPWTLWNDTLVLGMEKFLRNKHLEDEELAKVVDKIREIDCSAGSLMKITRMLKDMGEFELQNKLVGVYTNTLDPKWDSKFFNNISLKMLQGEQSLLKSVIRQIPTKQEKPFNEEKPLVEIGRLYHAMKWGEKPFLDLKALVDGIQQSVVDEVIKGMLIVHEIVRDNIYSEANWVLGDSQNDRMHSKIPELVEEHEPSWESAKSLLDKNLLIQALSYPSQTIASNATLLLVNCFESTEIITQFTEAFIEAKGDSLFYFTGIAEHILEENALDVIIQRLKGEWTKGLRFLYSSLPSFSQAKNNILISNLLMDGIKDTEPILVKSAAEAMLKIGVNYNEEEILKIAMFWDTNGVLCNRDRIQVTGSHCPKCNIVPDTPLPQLILLLKKYKYFSLEERMDFSKHSRSDVQKAGFEVLAYYLAINTTEIKKIVQDIKNNIEPSPLLEAIFSIDHLTLEKFSKELLSLINSINFDVRKRLLKEVANCQWADKSESVSIVELALSDENSSVRDEAVITHRSLQL